MTVILAIDPGLTGALAFYSTDTPDRVAVYDMPVVNGEVDPHQVKALLNIWHPVFSVIEQVGPMPRDGVKQAWRFSGAYHIAKTVVKLHNIELQNVSPAVWKRAFNVKRGPDGKEHARELAIEKFPACAAHFNRKRDQGRAEAALLALYGNRRFEGNF